MYVKDIVKAYNSELDNWQFFSDSQKAYYADGYIFVCLRNYNWYKTREKIKDPLVACRALFEIDWIAEYDDEGEHKFINYSEYWSKL